jgi:sugar/nucleoside kinase (ribokinase family)
MITNVLGFGQIIWDYTVFVDFSYLEGLDLHPGDHRTIDNIQFRDIILELEQEGKTIIKNPGGSCANVMSNMAKLGSSSAFCGKHGKDEDGYRYMEILQEEGVKTLSLIDDNNDTGKLLSLITPDKERTFVVYRGASAFLPAEMVDKKKVQSYDLIHMEGYLLFNSNDALERLFEIARETTFDLAHARIIRESRGFVHQLMQKTPCYVLFANESEGKAFTQEQDHHKILDKMLNYAELAILTLGEKGVKIKTTQGEYHNEPAVVTEPVDTTGAGDAFCGGFLHSYLKEGDIQKAAKLGVQAASKTIEKIGARSFQAVQLEE